jgi:uncharacterized protein (TIGR00661 family)
MANILYGVNGEGAGHSTRAKEVLSHLRDQGHNLHVVSFDRGLRNLSADFDVTEIYGLRFAYVNNRVRYQRTLAKNLITAPRAARSIRQLTKLTEEWETELVITDFEPLSCHVGRKRRLPIISIDNQHGLTNTDIPRPHTDRRDMAATKLITRMMTPRADAYLVTSFLPARPRRRNTFVFPPIVRREVLSTKPSQGEHVLVYVTSPSADLIKLLSKVRCKFIAYGFGQEGQQGNILFKKPDMDEFLRDLATCKAIIANAGFSLVSEALYLGKPYLAVPVKHQFEQILNAYHLEKSGYGAYWKNLKKEHVDSFLFNLATYEDKLKSYPREGNNALLAKLDFLIEEELRPQHRGTEDTEDL